VKLAAVLNSPRSLRQITYATVQLSLLLAGESEQIAVAACKEPPGRIEHRYAPTAILTAQIPSECEAKSAPQYAPERIFQDINAARSNELKENQSPNLIGGTRVSRPDRDAHGLKNTEKSGKFTIKILFTLREHLGWVFP
jgi:hypothetical protein